MSLIIATGSNLGKRTFYLESAQRELCIHFELIEKGRIYESQAMDYLDQPPFLNQILVFKNPDCSPQEALKTCLQIEQHYGRERLIPKGPRTLDIDLIFFDHCSLQSKDLTLPHPRWRERPFVTIPLLELQAFRKLQPSFSPPKDFFDKVWPYQG